MGRWKIEGDWTTVAVLIAGAGYLWGDPWRATLLVTVVGVVFGIHLWRKGRNKPNPPTVKD